LFGRNTIGGAILMSTADPGDKLGGAARGGFGSDKLFDGFLALNAPLSDALKARFTAGRRKQDGYVTRTDGTDLGDTNTYPLTSQLEGCGSSLNVGYNFTDFTALKFITAYRRLSWLGNRDADNTPLTILNTFYNVKGWQSSQELQLTYQRKPVTGVVGVYYF